MKTISLEQSRWRILQVWLAGSIGILLFAITICLTRDVRDPQDWTSILGWVLPHLIPTASLILSVIGANAMNPHPDPTMVKLVYHRLVLMVLTAYLVAVVTTFLLEALVPFDLIQTMSIANLWLGPFQGIVSGVLSVLFFTK
ncbi:hypothetical protein [Neorhodopirellula pilleata]|uniref:Uncharacterized protein n=1 Tax=Neorhodopirellula pilleata TaxID=2714738 RepID=A0A5C5ZL81_9BACT|nr:hypothetical protein [Neorhodopirellula pilleata]TWT87950.1 hypothetical protein Pla100_58020 [Neorhodopirellula pilleata]